MSEKRFVLYEHKGAEYILDNPNTELDFIEMLGDCLDEEEIVDLLNELNDENEQLKQDKKRLIGHLWKYKSMDMNEIEEYILSRELLDEYGEAIMND